MGVLGCVPKLGMAATLIDVRWGGFNNRAIVKTKAAPQIKSYSAGNGYVYQYYFCEVNRVGVDGVAARLERRPLQG